MDNPQESSGVELKEYAEHAIVAPLSKEQRDFPVADRKCLTSAWTMKVYMYTQ